jgi:hypothetical protein
MLLDEIKENVLNYSVDKVDIKQLNKYHELVYNQGIDMKCGMCITEAYFRISKYYRKHINGDEYKRVSLLKLALVEFEKEQNYELCDFIKKRL